MVDVRQRWSDAELSRALGRIRADRAEFSFLSAAGFLPPEECSLGIHARTTRDLLRVGIMNRDEHLLLHALVLLQDLAERLAEPEEG